MGPVAADEIAAAHLLRPSVGAAQRALDVVTLRREADELDAALDRDASCREMFVQDRLRLGLGDEEEEREGGVLEADVEEPHANDAFADVHAQLERAVAALDQSLGDPQRLEALRACAAASRERAIRERGRADGRRSGRSSRTVEAGRRA